MEHAVDFRLTSGSIEAHSGTTEALSGLLVGLPRSVMAHPGAVEVPSRAGLLTLKKKIFTLGWGEGGMGMTHSGNVVARPTALKALFRAVEVDPVNFLIDSTWS